jgi:hypothetical protein
MNDDSLEGLPIVSRGAVRPGAFVPPTTQTALARRTPVTLDATPLAVLTQAQPMNLAPAWTALEGAAEKTSAMDRAKALRVRLMPFVGLWGLLGVIVGVVVLVVAQNAPGGALVGLLTFVAMTGATYVKLNGQDYEHSREGTERFKVATAADLARRQMEHEHELRRLALEAYLDQLDRREQER